MILVGAGLSFQEFGTVKHHFVFVSDKPAKSVSVAGTFNDWNKDKTPMTLESDGRTWSVDVNLKLGKHQYKFVRDGGEWLTDPKASRNEDDGNGNTNSILFILAREYTKPAKRGDGELTLAAVETSSALPYFNVDGTDCTIRLRTRKDDVANVVAIVNGKEVYAAREFSDELYDYYRAQFPWNRTKDLTYRFRLTDGKMQKVFPSKPHMVRVATFKPYVVPSWVENSVIYQIFPDRFENGSKTNDPSNVMPWNGKPTYSNRFGGDVAGVLKRLGYLKDLGISTIYFNPIFKSPSNHRYEADDFMVVDPEFGTNSEVKAMTSALKAAGISTVLDFAFNHTSPGSSQFKDLIENGANSKYKSWYFPKSFPIKVGENPNYEAWYGFPSMPKLNTVNPETRDYLLQVCKYWVKDVGIQGMRLDVANEVNMDFWRTMRPYVKSLNPNTWIVGEIWGDGNPWLKGDQFDSVMNYQFREATLRFVARGTEDASQYASSLMRVHLSYPPQVSRNMMNLLSSHDTARFINECKGDEDLAKLGAALQFTWIGEPSIYYGEELGMSGGADPDNRRGMEWSKANDKNPMLAYYKKLIQIRRKVNAFATGTADFVTAQGQTGAFSRIGKKDAALVAFNRSSQPQTISIRIPQAMRTMTKRGFFDAFTGSKIVDTGRPISLTLKPKSATILVAGPFSNLSLSQRRFAHAGFGSTPSESIHRSHKQS